MHEQTKTYSDKGHQVIARKPILCSGEMNTSTFFFFFQSWLESVISKTFLNLHVTLPKGSNVGHAWWSFKGFTCSPGFRFCCVLWREEQLLEPPGLLISPEAPDHVWFVTSFITQGSTYYFPFRVKMRIFGEPQVKASIYLYIFIFLKARVPKYSIALIATAAQTLQRFKVNKYILKNLFYWILIFKGLNNINLL